MSLRDDIAAARAGLRAELDLLQEGVMQLRALLEAGTGAAALLETWSEIRLGLVLSVTADLGRLKAQSGALTMVETAEAAEQEAMSRERAVMKQWRLPYADTPD